MPDQFEPANFHRNEWLVLAGSHGWSHGDQRSALTDAQWLAANHGLPIRINQQTRNHIMEKKQYDNSGILFRVEQKDAPVAAKAPEFNDSVDF
jgi:hypothetical protein